MTAFLITMNGRKGMQSERLSRGMVRHIRVVQDVVAAGNWDKVLQFITQNRLTKRRGFSVRYQK